MSVGRGIGAARSIPMEHAPSTRVRIDAKADNRPLRYHEMIGSDP